MKQQKYYWEFSFDLYQESLKVAYGKKSYKNAYNEIQRYLYKNHFNNVKDKQGSCYFTSEKLTWYKATAIIKKLFSTFPWLPECIRQSDLYIRPEKTFNFNKYCERVKNSDVHIKSLENYFIDNDLEMELSLKEDITRRKKESNDKKLSIKCKIKIAQVDSDYVNTKKEIPKIHNKEKIFKSRD